MFPQGASAFWNHCHSVIDGIMGCMGISMSWSARLMRTTPGCVAEAQVIAACEVSGGGGGGGGRIESWRGCGSLFGASSESNGLRGPNLPLRSVRGGTGVARVRRFPERGPFRPLSVNCWLPWPRVPVESW